MPILDSYGPSQYGPRGLGAAEVSRSCLDRRGCRSMADDARERGDREQPSLDEAALSARLKRLGERLGHVHSDRPSESSVGQRPTADPSAIARGFRLSTELVAGDLAVGNDCVFAARLRRGCSQRDAGSRGGSDQNVGPAQFELMKKTALA